MANDGLKSYAKLIQSDLTNGTRCSVNINKANANLHIEIPLINTIGPNPINLSMVYNYQNRNYDYDCGKGFIFNLYYQVYDYDDYIDLQAADGSRDRFNMDGTSYYSLESNMRCTRYYDEEENACYKFVDKNGNEMIYEGLTNHADELRFVNGDRLTMNYDELNNGLGDVVSFERSGRHIKHINYQQNGIVVAYVTINLNSSNQITDVMYYENNHLVSHTSVEYSNDTILVKDSISKIEISYAFLNDRVVEILKRYNDFIIEKAIQIDYEENKTKVRDNYGNYNLYYFDSNGFPLFEKSSSGAFSCQKYDQESKQLLLDTNFIINKKYESCHKLDISLFSRSSGIFIDKYDVNDADLVDVIDNVRLLVGSGTLTYTLNINGGNQDNLYLTIFGNEGTVFSNYSYVTVTMEVENNGKVINVFRKRVIDNRFDFMSLGMQTSKTYTKITITITMEETSIAIGGIRLIKRNFGSNYEYDSLGNLINKTGGDGSREAEFNAKNLLNNSVGEHSETYGYEYDDKQNLIKVKAAFGVKANFEYDKYNNLINSTTTSAYSNKITKRYTYTEDGRFLWQETDPLGNTITYDFDSLGKIKKVSNPLNVVREYRYNDYELLESILLNNDVKCSYTYDDERRINTITISNGSVYKFNYEYGLLSSIYLNENKIMSYEYSEGKLVKQHYGSADGYHFAYNSRDQVENIYYLFSDGSESLRFKYYYDSDTSLLEKVTDREDKTLYQYSYDDNDLVSKVTFDNGSLEYEYDNHFEVMKTKQTVNDQVLYHITNTTAKSLGFCPEALLGYLQHNPRYMGTMFIDEGSIKNDEYSIEAQRYDGNKIELNYSRKYFVPCVMASAANPISYFLPMRNSYPLDTGCVGFWFYPTSYAAKKYLFSVKANNSYDKIGVYMNNVGELVLETIDNKNIERDLIITSQTAQLNRWNFFGLTWMNRDDGYGYDDVCEYGLFLNSEVETYKKSNPRLYVEVSVENRYHIGYNYDGNSGNNYLEENIACLFIGNRSYLTIEEIKDIYRVSSEYLLGTYFIDEEFDGVNYGTSEYYKLNVGQSFTIYPLHNSVKSLDGISPIAYDVRRFSNQDKDRTFNFNILVGRYVYEADGSKLELASNISTMGTIFMRAFIKANADKQYFLIGYDNSGKTIGLYRGADKFLYISLNGADIKTSLSFSNSVWHSVAITFIEREDLESITICVYLDGQTYTTTQAISASFQTLTISLGRHYNLTSTSSNLGFQVTSNSLLGQIENVALKNAYSEVSTIASLATELTPDSKMSEYDDLGMLRNIKIGNLFSISNYYKVDSNDNISNLIDREFYDVAGMGNTREYTYDYLNRVTVINDTKFGSHTYEYDSRGFLIKEDDISYTYDDNGNITQAGNTTFTYDSLIKDRLISVNDKAIAYYSNNPLFVQSYDGHTFIYEGRRLTEYTDSNGTYLFTYNDQGLITSKRHSNGRETKYYYDGDSLITEITPDYRNDFLYDENGLIYGFIHNLTDEYFYIRDFLQNIIGIADSSGKLCVEYYYNAYGVITSIKGNLASTIGINNPFKYKGYYYDNETQLYWVSSRYYSPELCRWISPDSIEYLDPESINGLNLYAYCNNDPVNKYDPSGHFAISALIIGAIIGATIGFGGTVLADYVDDGQIFNGSISAGSYIANTLVGGLIGGLTGGIASSSFTFTYPTLQFAQMATTEGLILGSVSVGTATATISGVSVVTALGLAGVTVMAARIGKSGGYRIDHHYPNDHAPTHVHISGDDGTTRVDINGNPIQGDRPMTPGEKKAFWRLIEKIIEALKPWM